MCLVTLSTCLLRSPVMPPFPSIFQSWPIINEAFICFIILMPSPPLASGRRQCALLLSLKLRSDRLAQSFFFFLAIIYLFIYAWVPMCAHVGVRGQHCMSSSTACLFSYHFSSWLLCLRVLDPPVSSSLQAWACRHTGLSGFYVGVENPNPDPRDFTVISPVSFRCLFY